MAVREDCIHAGIESEPGTSGGPSDGPVPATGDLVMLEERPRAPMPNLTRKRVVVVLAVIAVWGAFVRLWNVGARPFWRDEAWVAAALRDLSYADLLRQTDVPLPPLFAVTSKLVGQVVLPPEMGHRVPAAVWGMLVPPLVYLAARVLRAPRALALGAAGLAASSLMLVIWSRELKHYSFEGLISVLIAWLVFRARRARTRREYGLVGTAIVAVGVAAPWYAYGAVFPMLSVLPLLFWPAPRCGARRRGVWLGLAGLAALAASTLGVWAAVGRAQAAVPALANFAALWYPNPLDGQSWFHIAGYAAATTFTMFLPGDWCLPARTEQDFLVLALVVAVVWLLALLGVATWPRSGRVELACWVLGPWLIMFAAALARWYPFALPRMMQFCVPPMTLALTAGVLAVGRGASHLVVGRGAPAMLAIVLLGVLPGPYVLRQALTQCYGVFQDFPAALRALGEQRRPGELVFVDVTAAPCVRYYAPDLAPPVIAVPTAGGTLCATGVDEREVARKCATRGGRRFWVLYVGEPRGNLRCPSLDVIRKGGYRLEVRASCGGGSESAGAAELVLAQRP